MKLKLLKSLPNNLCCVFFALIKKLDLKDKKSNYGISDNAKIIIEGKSAFKFNAILDLFTNKTANSNTIREFDQNKVYKALKSARKYYENLIPQDSFSCPKSIELSENYQYADIEKVISAASEYGIDIENEPFLLWIARMAICMPLPPFWRKKTVAGKNFYFSLEYNILTDINPLNEFIKEYVQRVRILIGNEAKNTKFSKFYDALLREYITESPNLHQEKQTDLYESAYNNSAIKNMEKQLGVFESDPNRLNKVRKSPLQMAPISDLEILEISKQIGLDLPKESYLLLAIEEIIKEIKNMRNEIWEFREVGGVCYWTSSETKLTTPQYPFLDEIKQEVNEIKKEKEIMRNDEKFKNSYKQPKLLTEISETIKNELKQEAQKLVAVAVDYSITHGSSGKYDATKLADFFGRKLTKEEILDYLFACPFNLSDEKPEQKNEIPLKNSPIQENIKSNQCGPENDLDENIRNLYDDILNPYKKEQKSQIPIIQENHADSPKPASPNSAENSPNAEERRQNLLRRLSIKKIEITENSNIPDTPSLSNTPTPRILENTNESKEITQDIKINLTKNKKEDELLSEKINVKDIKKNKNPAESDKLNKKMSPINKTEKNSPNISKIAKEDKKEIRSSSPKYKQKIENEPKNLASNEKIETKKSIGKIENSKTTTKILENNNEKIVDKNIDKSLDKNIDSVVDKNVDKNIDKNADKNSDKNQQKSEIIKIENSLEKSSEKPQSKILEINNTEFLKLEKIPESVEINTEKSNKINKNEILFSENKEIPNKNEKLIDNNILIKNTEKLNDHFSINRTKDENIIIQENTTKIDVMRLKNNDDLLYASPNKNEVTEKIIQDKNFEISKPTIIEPTPRLPKNEQQIISGQNLEHTQNYNIIHKSIEKPIIHNKLNNSQNSVSNHRNNAINIQKLENKFKPKSPIKILSKSFMQQKAKLIKESLQNQDNNNNNVSCHTIDNFEQFCEQLINSYQTHDSPNPIQTTRNTELIENHKNIIHKPIKLEAISKIIKIPEKFPEKIYSANPEISQIPYETQNIDESKSRIQRNFSIQGINSTSANTTINSYYTKKGAKISEEIQTNYYDKPKINIYQTEKLQTFGEKKITKSQIYENLVSFETAKLNYMKSINNEEKYKPKIKVIINNNLDPDHISQGNRIRFLLNSKNPESEQPKIKSNNPQTEAYRTFVYYYKLLGDPTVSFYHIKTSLKPLKNASPGILVKLAHRLGISVKREPDLMWIPHLQLGTAIPPLKSYNMRNYEEIANLRLGEHPGDLYFYFLLEMERNRKNSNCNENMEIWLPFKDAFRTKLLNCLKNNEIYYYNFANKEISFDLPKELPEILRPEKIEPVKSISDIFAKAYEIFQSFKVFFIILQ